MRAVWASVSVFVARTFDVMIGVGWPGAYNLFPPSLLARCVRSVLWTVAHSNGQSGALATTFLTDYAQPADEAVVWSIWEGNARVKR